MEVRIKIKVRIQEASVYKHAKEERDYALVSNAITSLRTGPPFRPRTLGFTTYPSCTYLGPHVRGCSSHHTHAVGCYHTYTHPLDTTATM